MALKWSAYQVQHNFVSAPVVYPALKHVLKQEQPGRPATVVHLPKIQTNPKDQTPVTNPDLDQDQV